MLIVSLVMTKTQKMSNVKIPTVKITISHFYMSKSMLIWSSHIHHNSICTV